MTANQNPEQKARDAIDALLQQAGWVVQDNKKINFNAGLGVAVREYQTDVGPADYVLFVAKNAVGVIEAKRQEQGHNLTVVEEQTEGYAAAKLKWINNQQPLPFLYESTGILTRFTDTRDPKPRSREIFSFHRPETLKAWLEQSESLRAREQHLPPLNPHQLPAADLRLRECQEIAIANLETLFKADRPRALIQMATGAGKTYTAITAMYRLLKYAKSKRILFLVDTKNLGEQAEQELMSYVPLDDNRKFTELYNVQRLKSSFIARDSQVCISTIQRIYSILQGEDLDETLELRNPAEQYTRPKAPLPVSYNAQVPPEFFDYIFIDECHRSIYNLWQQVLDYFDARLIGLTATPDNRTYGFFRKNVVSDYSHEKAVADGVNVGNEIYVIETEVTRAGAQIKAQQQVERREKLTRKKRWVPSLEPPVAPRIPDLRRLPLYYDELRTAFLHQRSGQVPPATDIPGYRTYLNLLRNQASMDVLFATGCRIKEVLDLDRLDVVHAGAIRDAVTVEGKGRKKRTIYFDAAAQTNLKTYLLARRALFPQADALFISHGPRSAGQRLCDVSAWRIVKEAAEALAEIRECEGADPAEVRALRKVSPHTFRHFFAQEMLDHGADLRRISRALGHSSTKMTEQFYADPKPQQVRDDIEQHRPKRERS